MSNEAEYIPTEAIEEVSLAKGSESALAKAMDTDAGKPLLTMSDVEEGYVTLKIAKALLGLKHLVYVRRLVKENKLEGIRVSVPGGSRWLITKESIEGYSTQRRDTSGNRRYILRISLEDEGKVRAALKKAGVEHELKLAYEGKKKSAKPSESLWAKVIENLGD